MALAEYFGKISLERRLPQSGVPWLFLAFSLTLNIYQHCLLRRCSVLEIDPCDGCCDASQAKPVNGHAFHSYASDDRIIDADMADLFLDLRGLQLEKFLKRPQVRELLARQSSSSENSDNFEPGGRMNSFARNLVSSASNSSSNSATAASSGTSSSDASHHSHPQDAMIFLFNALVIGAGVCQVSAKYPFLQQTVVLFVLGLIFSLLMEGLDLKNNAGVLGKSYDMWMDIDPHLLMFSLLPALLAGDAMTIDTSVAKRVAYQCLYLAGPGVVFCAMVTALFLKVYIGWDFLLSLIAGSILCATDPVAVVALLKELGASPVLTVQIQGESLLNDGTAIVLFLISYNMKSGESYDGFDIVMFLVKKAMMAWALGLFIGYLFFSWIRAASDRLSHHSSSIQISLTLCCAYWSFIMVEGVLKLSGVLATVASSLVLAHHMWPHIVCPDSLHHVWHTFESLGNIVVFFLAGALTGEVMTRIEPRDFVDLFVIYLFLLLLRAALIFASAPILQALSTDGQKVTFADCALMTWGGLRGAVGLALAIQVMRSKAEDKDGVPQISNRDAQRLLFFVSGIAFLTTIINAVTAPMLVERLGITALPHARQQLLKMFHQQLVYFSADSSHPPEVTESLKAMLAQAEDEIDRQQVDSKGPASIRTSLDSRHDMAENIRLRNSLTTDHVGRMKSKESLEVANVVAAAKSAASQTNAEIVQALDFERSVYKTLDKEDLKFVMAHLPADHLLGDVDDMTSLIKHAWVDEGMAKVVNTCFLNLVSSNYWKLMDSRQLRPGSLEADVLLTSIRVSLGPYRADLGDFETILEHLRREGNEFDENRPSLNLLEDMTFSTSLASRGTSPRHKPASRLRRQDSQASKTSHALSEGILSAVTEGLKQRKAEPVGARFVDRLVLSAQFNICVAVAIFLNSIQVAIEEAVRDDSNDNHASWLILDAFFTAFFTAEFLLKLMHLCLGYFKDAWNRFDFVLVVLGISGLVMTIVTTGASDATGQVRIIRLARVLRTLRFLRVFRLFHAKLSADKYVSVDLAKHMKKIQTLTCFCHAHLTAQKDLLKYFGAGSRFDNFREAELARCVCQSQIYVYRALGETVREQKKLDKDLLEEMYYVNERKNITENLEKFVLAAHADGAISARETNAIIHPLHHQIAVCMSVIAERAEGLLDRKVEPKVEANDAAKGDEGKYKKSQSTLTAGSAYPHRIISGALNLMRLGSKLSCDEIGENLPDPCVSRRGSREEPASESVELRDGDDRMEQRSARSAYQHYSERSNSSIAMVPPNVPDHEFIPCETTVTLATDVSSLI